LILATERLQEIYHHTCVEGDLNLKQTKSHQQMTNNDNKQKLRNGSLSKSRDKENEHSRKRHTNKTQNSKSSKSRDKYQANLPEKGLKTSKGSNSVQNLNLEEKEVYLNQINQLMSQNQKLKS
jgi:hypothetical protein